jgi:hypothetical protein
MGQTAKSSKYCTVREFEAENCTQFSKNKKFNFKINCVGNNNLNNNNNNNNNKGRGEEEKEEKEKEKEEQEI